MATVEGRCSRDAQANAAHGPGGLVNRELSLAAHYPSDWRAAVLSGGLWLAL